METFKIQKSALIKRISAIEDKEILESLITILDHYQADKSIHTTTDLEKKAIAKGMQEIREGNCLSQEEIDIRDLKWLREK